MAGDPTSLTIGVPKETSTGERRVALVPADLKGLAKAGFEVLVEAGAGARAGFKDAEYARLGAHIAPDREALGEAQVILSVRAGAADAEQPMAVIEKLRAGQILIALCDPLWDPKPVEALAERQVMTFALELMPRITRAQSMDVLSSMATIAGYKAMLLAANAAPRMFPMMMTAAGTLTPAHVFVIGAGVAGLNAIATAHRLGAVVHAYDVRPAAREQIVSVGGKAVDLGLESRNTEDKGGYAKAMDADFYRRQREAMGRVIAESDVVVTTALVPGKTAPVLVTRDMVAGMAPGSVIVDLAAERGGNCEVTRTGETADVGGVLVIGPVNIASSIPLHASQMFSRNVAAFLQHLKKSGLPNVDTNEEIIRETLLTRGGEVIHPKVREVLASTRSVQMSGAHSPEPGV